MREFWRLIIFDTALVFSLTGIATVWHARQVWKMASDDVARLSAIYTGQRTDLVHLADDLLAYQRANHSDLEPLLVKYARLLGYTVAERQEVRQDGKPGGEGQVQGPVGQEAGTDSEVKDAPGANAGEHKG